MPVDLSALFLHADRLRVFVWVPMVGPAPVTNVAQMVMVTRLRTLTDLEVRTRGVAGLLAGSVALGDRGRSGGFAASISAHKTLAPDFF